MSDMQNKEFLSIDEISNTMGVSRQTVSKYIQERKLNAIKIKKNYKIHYKDFEQFLNDNSTVKEIKPVYAIKSRNCSLQYDDKHDEFEVLHKNVFYRTEQIGKEHNEPDNFFLFGDNYIGLRYLLEHYYEKIDLIYIDPPFGTGRDFGNLENEIAYQDNLIDHHYLEFLRRRLILMRELLSKQGSIYVHTDKKIGHYVKVILDEVFGFKNFINDITRIKCNPKNFARAAYGNYSDMILFYAKERDNNIWNDVREKLTEEEEIRLFPKYNKKFGRYTTHPLHAPGITNNGDTGEKWNGMLPPKGRHWRYSRTELTKLNNNGLIEWSSTNNPRKIVLASEHKGKKVQDIWEFKDKGLSQVEYPTQKNDSLLQRIILNSSNSDSIVLDAFAGSGSTLLNAQNLGRRWIGIDNSPLSIEVIKKKFRKHKIKCNYIAIYEQN